MKRVRFKHWTDWTDAYRYRQDGPRNMGSSITVTARYRRIPR